MRFTALQSSELIVGGHAPVKKQGLWQITYTVKEFAVSAMFEK